MTKKVSRKQTSTAKRGAKKSPAKATQKLATLHPTYKMMLDDASAYLGETEGLMLRLLVAWNDENTEDTLRTFAELASVIDAAQSNMGSVLRSAAKGSEAQS
jgi:hypothetical protein